ncbi:DUF3883 domain-containing protein, partial [Pirellulaceae bacterium]|nr:DUF3883 domain-containing protein [Pirellulaceae bacterium]
ESLIDKTNDAVKQRLTQEIAYWDHRAQELKAQEESGKQPKMNSKKAQGRADELSDRLQKRLVDLEQEKKLSPLPPVVQGGALVIPIGLINKLSGKSPSKEAIQVRDTKRSELLGMNAVMEVEIALGNQPRDVSEQKCGYDIESTDGRNGRLRFLEVKGRVVGAETVTVTRNEVVTAINSRENYYLVVVQIGENDSVLEPVYIKNPFEREPEFSASSTNYKLTELLAKGGPAQ